MISPLTSNAITLSPLHLKNAVYQFIPLFSNPFCVVGPRQNRNPRTSAMYFLLIAALSIGVRVERSSSTITQPA